MIGIVILNYNSHILVKRLLENLENIENIDKIVIVDNKSTDNSLKYLEQYVKKDKIFLLKNEINAGYSSGNNIGIKYIINKFKEINYITILNPDVRLLERDTFNKLVYYYKENEAAGIISPLMLMNGEVLNNLISWKSPQKFDNIFNSIALLKKIKDIFMKKEEKDTIPGSFLFFEKKIIEEINFFDEGTFLYFEENILSQKLKKIKKKMLIIENIRYDHLHSIERKNMDRKLKHTKIYFESMIYYEKKYNKRYSKLTVPMIKVLIYIRKLEIYLSSLFRKV